MYLHPAPIVPCTVILMLSLVVSPSFQLAQVRSETNVYCVNWT
uniref:Uncharacterized protein n=1 Tax=Anguilla anguilla TaxID=7936 RepID=A0A0E9T6V8_ANGAN